MTKTNQVPSVTFFSVIHHNTPGAFSFCNHYGVNSMGSHPIVQMCTTRDDQMFKRRKDDFLHMNSKYPYQAFNLVHLCILNCIKKLEACLSTTMASGIGPSSETMNLDNMQPMVWTHTFCSTKLVGS